MPHQIERKLTLMVQSSSGGEGTRSIGRPVFFDGQKERTSIRVRDPYSTSNTIDICRGPWTGGEDPVLQSLQAGFDRDRQPRQTSQRLLDLQSLGARRRQAMDEAVRRSPPGTPPS